MTEKWDFDWMLTLVEFASLSALSRPCNMNEQCRDVKHKMIFWGNGLYRMESVLDFISS